MLTDELKRTIQSAYSTFLESKALKARYGQRLMIAEVAKTLGNIELDAQGVCLGAPAMAAIEAGTGTGKTVAYCLAAIPVAQQLQKKLVIATATVALQEQIVYKDLPDLMNNSGLKFSFALAKGRGRYLCLSKLDFWLQKQDKQQNHADFFAEEGFSLDVDATQHNLFTHMLEELSTSHWDGDRDSWPEALEDKTWSLITTDHIQCTGRRCSHFQQCAFYRAREGLDEVDVIVANHDIVLADLALGGGKILPDPANALYIFDEGHHLADKAIGHFSCFTRLKGTGDWLMQLSKNAVRSLAQQPHLSGDLRRLLERLRELAEALYEPQQFVFITCEQLADFNVNSERNGYDKPRHRFPHGLIPENLAGQGTELKQGFLQLKDCLLCINDILKKAIEDGQGSGLSRQTAEIWLPSFGRLYARAESNFNLWASFTAQDPEGSVPTARWLALVNSSIGMDIEVNASPILAAETLRRNLWQRACGVILTSATLTALGSFERLRMRSGLPHEATTLVVPSSFEYGRAGLLQVPDLRVDVRDAVAHTDAIVRELPNLLQNVLGALVLFSSRKQMQDVFEMLDDDWRQRVLLQGKLSRQETLSAHRTRVDEHQPSVLFGLASFAEGIDLPGNYCQHVVIAKIPFSVPDEPVEAALAEWVEACGGNAFMEISVPDASLRLIQACGRLLRNEQDRGVITILDRRLVTQRYGKAILNALPAFTQRLN